MPGLARGCSRANLARGFGDASSGDALEVPILRLASPVTILEVWRKLGSVIGSSSAILEGGQSNE